MSIKVEKVKKCYGKQEALKNISFSIKKGEIVGFLGPNGAGKSTMMKIISCYINQTEGKVHVCNLCTNTDSQKIKKIIGYLPENNPVYPNMYVKEYLLFLCGIHKIQNSNVLSVIEKVGLQKESNKKIGELSKGYKQRIGLAQALIHDPQVLILDEPTTGLDPNQVIEIRNLIRRIGQEKTVLFSTHIMQEVENICNRAIIVNNGKIVADNSIENIIKMEGSLEKSFQKLTTSF